MQGDKIIISYTEIKYPRGKSYDDMSMTTVLREDACELKVSRPTTRPNCCYNQGLSCSATGEESRIRSISLKLDYTFVRLTKFHSGTKHSLTPWNRTVCFY